MRTLSIDTPSVFEPLLSEARYKGAKGGRGSGKSYFFADSMIEALVMDPNKSAACMREVQKSIAKSSKKLIEERIRHYGVQDYFEILQTEIRCTRGNGVIIFNGLQDHTVDSIKSLEGFDICWVEEAQSISEHSLDILTPTFRKDGAELWFSWNPRYQTDAIKKLFREKKNSILVHADYLNNPFCTKSLIEEAEEMKINDYEKYQHIYLGKEKDNLDSLFSFTLLHQSNNRNEITNDGVHTWALDVARYGDDKSELTVRKGQELYHKESFTKIDTMELAAKVSYLYKREVNKPQAVYVDVVGVGAGVADRLNQLGLPVIEVNGAAASDNPIYLNKRTEMYFNLKEWMERNRAVTDDETDEELMAMEYEYGRNEKIQLVPKKKIKDTIGRSPDKADSYAMHFAYPVFAITSGSDEEDHIMEDALW